MKKAETHSNSLRLIGTLLFALLLCVNMYAQGLIVKGHITDSNGEPVIGANIVVKGTTIGTITDFDGNFSLEVPDKNSVLRIGYIGYKDVETTASSTPLNIVLKEDTELLDEVVVIGYGTVKKIGCYGFCHSHKA